MALPTSREVNAVNGAPLDPSVINALQDSIIGAKRAANWRQFFPPKGYIETNIAYDPPAAQVFGGGIISTGAADYAASLGGWEIGDRITGLGIRLLGVGGVHTVNVNLYLSPGTGGILAAIGALAIVNPPAAWATYDLDPIGSITTMLAGWSLHVDILMPVANMCFNAIRVKSDRL